MALNFPSNPGIGSVYTDTTSGFSYEWDGTVWQSYTAAASKNISIIDDISGSFDGVESSFALNVSGAALVPANAQQLRIVLGGVVQEPVTDYNVSFSNIVFTTPPTGGLSFSGVSLGPAFAVSVPGDGTVTPVKLSSGGPSWNTSGDVLISGIATASSFVGSANLTQLNVSGITTISNASGTVIIGVGTTALLVDGNARVTGILTIGTSSITLDGFTNIMNVGTGVTIYGNTGIISATTINASNFVGDGSGLTGAGSTVADDTSTDSTFYPLFTATTSGTVTDSKVSTTKLSFNPSSGTLTVGIVTATTLVSSAGTMGTNATGNRTIQSGGTASGGSSGDIYYIY